MWFSKSSSKDELEENAVVQSFVVIYKISGGTFSQIIPLKNIVVHPGDSVVMTWKWDGKHPNDSNVSA